MNNSKNIKLFFIYVAITVSDLKKEYTFITPNKDLSETIQESFTESKFIPISIDIVKQEKHLISVLVDTEWHSEVIELFKKQAYLRYEGFLPLDATLDTPSFTKDILLKSGKLKAITPVEVFLASHNILKSYYEKKVQFMVEITTTERSKELGKRDFIRSEKTNVLTDEVLNGKTFNCVWNDVYRSSSKGKVLSIHGINDDNKTINLKIN